MSPYGTISAVSCPSTWRLERHLTSAVTVGSGDWRAWRACIRRHYISTSAPNHVADTDAPSGCVPGGKTVARASFVMIVAALCEPKRINGMRGYEMTISCLGKWSVALSRAVTEIPQIYAGDDLTPQHDADMTTVSRSDVTNASGRHRLASGDGPDDGARHNASGVCTTCRYLVCYIKAHDRRLTRDSVPLG